MKDITNTTDIRQWTVDWFENRFAVTRDCIESSEKLTDFSCFDDTDRFFLEYDVETDFFVAVPEGCFDECLTLDSIVNKIKELTDKDA